MRIPSVRSAVNSNAGRELRSAESAQREKKCLDLARFVKCVTLKMAYVQLAAISPSVESSARHVIDTFWVNQVSYVLFAGIRIR
jgi:hypothetical protein